LGAQLQQARARGLGISPHRRQPSPFSSEQTKEIVEIVESSSLEKQQLPGHGWTLKKLVAWVESNQKITTCRNTIRKLLHKCKLSWKKCKKLLAKRDPLKRSKYMILLQELYEQVKDRKILLVYVDELHFHRDMDLDYSWWK
jgi:transposase